MLAAPLRTRFIVALASTLLAAFSPASTAAADLPRWEIAVVQGLTQKSLNPMAPGYLEWMRQRLASAGIVVAPGSVSRVSIDEIERPADPSTTRSRLQHATGATSTLLVDLQTSSRGLEIGLRLFDTESGQLKAGRLSDATHTRLAEDGNRALQALLPAMGHPDSTLETPPPVTMDEISGLARALRHFDRGKLTNAWREIAKSSVIGAQALRNEIAAAATRADTPQSERARLLAAQGNPSDAWALIARQAPAELSRPAPDLDLLQAAGEIQAARGRLSDASRYFQHSLSVKAKNAETTLGLAEVLTTQRKTVEARRLLDIASRLDRDSPKAISLLASMETDPALGARLLLSTGGREARRLNPGRAQLYFSRAAKLDPSISAVAQDRTGQLHEELGEPAAARESYRNAISQGGETGPRLHQLARVEQAIGDYEAAQGSYLRSLDLVANESEVLTDLGDLYIESGRIKEAVLTLEHAHALEPQHPAVGRSLARALTLRNQSGDKARATQLFVAANERLAPAAQDLIDLAALQREAGDLAAARQSFESALVLRPISPSAQRDLAAVIHESGDEKASLTASAQARILSSGAASRAPEETSALPGAPNRSQLFEALVDSFLPPEPQLEPQTVVLLGLHLAAPLTLEDRIRAWLRPRALDIAGLEQDLANAIARDHASTGYDLAAPELASELSPAVSQLVHFGRDDSLDPDIIASLNEAFDSDALFVAVAIPRSRSAAAACGSSEGLEIELRKLSGAKSYRVGALSSSACVPIEHAATGPWRWQAATTAGLVLLCFIAPLLRGWGDVIVDFKLPPHTKALFAVSLKRRPRKLKDRSARRAGPASWLFQKRLQSLNRYERRLVGKRIAFRWIPARRREYYLTVRGPLLDYTTEQIIGDFLEEKTVRVRRGKATKIDFDMCPSEAAIEICVTVGGVVVRQAQVCLRGIAGSLRYASEGSAFVYAGEGEHVLCAADGGSLAEQTVRVETHDPVRVSIDLENPKERVFADCPTAVDAYMAGDFRTAADQLAAAGQDQEAHRVRALWYRARGDRAAEARELAASGQIVASAEVLATDSDPAAAAELFEQAGEHKRAAEAYQRAGNAIAAARNFESAYDYENAVECYRDLGDSEKVIQLLETTGDYFEAARAAASANQPDRAISNYQHVDNRHPRYSEVCRDMGTLLASRGHVDLAIEKFGEALELGGDSALPLETLTAFGQLLEDNGRGGEALDIYERVRRRDLNYSNVSARIDNLKDDATRLAGATTQSDALPTRAAAPEASRYELIDELGRGGMGVVYKARDKHLGRLVAMKFLPDNLQQHPAAVKLFLREARATAALNHPNIVTMYDAAQQDGRYFISMECLEGVALDAVLKKRGPLPEKLLAQLGMQVCAGLDYAHRNRIVHRDIKPSNLFVTKERVLKIMDFGLAKAIEEVRKNSTVIGGTPNFMAPEQAAGEPVDQRTDLYSLGATLFQLLTGSVPFESGDVAYHHRNTAPPDARERLATVSAAFAALLLQLMAKDPNQRVQSAGEIAQQLKRIFEAG